MINNLRGELFNYPIDIQYFVALKVSERNAKGAQKGMRVPTLKKERSRNAFLKFEERPMPWNFKKSQFSLQNYMI